MKKTLFTRILLHKTKTAIHQIGKSSISMICCLYWPTGYCDIQAVGRNTALRPNSTESKCDFGHFCSCNPL